MKKGILTLLLVVAALLFILPFVYTVFQSFYFIEGFSMKGYKDLFFDAFTFYPMFWNTVLYSVAITILQLFISIPCAFGFRFSSFKWKHALYVFYIMLMMMPLQVTILPNYIGLRDFGLINTRFGIILPMLFAPFSVIVMYQFMRGMEDSFIEAARLDTSSLSKIVFMTVVPQLKVCIFALVLFVFSESWNMVEQPLLFLKEDALKTLTIFISQTNLYSKEVLLSASVIFMIPVLLLYLFFNEHLEEGLTLTIRS